MMISLLNQPVKYDHAPTPPTPTAIACVVSIAAQLALFALIFFHVLLLGSTRAAVQVGGRHDEWGNSKDTQSERRRARMYWQALLDEVHVADGVATIAYGDWVQEIANAGKDVMIDAVGKLCTRLLKKVEGSEQWINLPSTAPGGSVRDIKHSVCHIMSMTLRGDLNAGRPNGWNAMEGSVYDNNAFSKAETILKARYGAEKTACGTEARQRSDNELFDFEQIELIESILGGKVAQQQRARGVTDRAARKAIDTLSLGVVNQLHFALGQRGVNVRGRGLHARVPACQINRLPPVRARGSSIIAFGATCACPASTTARSGRV